MCSNIKEKETAVENGYLIKHESNTDTMCVILLSSTKFFDTKNQLI